MLCVLIRIASSSVRLNLCSRRCCTGGLGVLHTGWTGVLFVLVWICRFPLPLGVWEGLRFVALPGLFSDLFVYTAAELGARVVAT